MTTIKDHFKFFKITEPNNKVNSMAIRIGIITSTVYEWGSLKSGWRSINGWKISENFKLENNKIIDKKTDTIWTKKKISNDLALDLVNN